MNYLTPTEQKRVYLARGMYPKRPLAEIEEEIASLIRIYAMPTEGATAVKVKQNAVIRSLGKLNELTCSSRLSGKFKDAMTSPEKFEEFTEQYPYAKYGDLINGGLTLTPIEQLAKDGFSEETIKSLIRWVGMIGLTFKDDLPKGHDTFIWTPEMGYYSPRSLAEGFEDKAFYGVSLPTTVQSHVNAIFGDNTASRMHGSSLWAMHHVRRYQLCEYPELWERFGMKHLADMIFADGVKMSFNNTKQIGFTYTHKRVSYLGLYWLEINQESTNTRLRFLVEGE